MLCDNLLEKTLINSIYHIHILTSIDFYFKKLYMVW